jgi:energy-coupling factor transporter ATP-binding protein EcfA2
VQTLKEYREKSGAALLLATLDASLAGSLANRLGVLGKDGIRSEGPPREILAGPAKDGIP